MHRGLTPTMKAALAIIGIPAGVMHPRWPGLSDEERSELMDFLRGTLAAPAYRNSGRSAGPTAFPDISLHVGCMPIGPHVYGNERPLPATATPSP